MFSSNSIKIFLGFALLSCQACSFWQTKTDATPSPVVGELKSEIPFANKEPDNYQTEIVVTTGGIEDKIFVARNGVNRLMVFDFQKSAEIAHLQIGKQSFLIAHRQKIFAENESGTGGFEARGESLNDSLTAVWLNQKRGAKFENLGAENNLTKYRVGLDDAPNSEIIISVDEKIGLPVKQEFYSSGGEQKILTLTTELKNFSLQPEAKFFEVPKDYRKVSPKEFYETLRREQLKEK